jgi:hypothetical protein
MLMTISSCCRGEPSIKVAALNLMAAAVEGLGNNDRNVLIVHAEALKTADKYAKDKYSDNTLRRGRTECTDTQVTISCPALTLAKALPSPLRQLAPAPATTAIHGAQANTGYRLASAP